MRALADGRLSTTVAAARRVERCEALAAEVGGRALPLDVDRPGLGRGARRRALPEVAWSCTAPAARSGSSGSSDADEEHWREMFESNVARRRPGDQGAAAERCGGRRNPTIVIVGSVAGVEVYEGGGGYTAAKHAVHAIAQTMRLELHRENGSG